MTDAEIDRMARAICREQCAFYGEPPCHAMGEWPNTGCDEPGCMALARAAAEVRAENERYEGFPAGLAERYPTTQAQGRGPRNHSCLATN
jgi:hypothetical protein